MINVENAVFARKYNEIPMQVVNESQCGNTTSKVYIAHELFLSVARNVVTFTNGVTYALDDYSELTKIIDDQLSYYA